MNLQTILLQAATPEQSTILGMNPNIIMILLLLVVFYFFLIRPQMKRQKEMKKFRDGLQVGNEVVTSGGIHGKIKEIKNDCIILEIANNVNIKVDKGSVFASAADTQTK